LNKQTLKLENYLTNLADIFRRDSEDNAKKIMDAFFNYLQP
jgi:hypothetical protein